jgi:hypothetical protein
MTRTGHSRYRGPLIDEDGVKIIEFEIEEHSIENLRAMIHGGRHTRPGTYHKLVVDHTLWMSDTDAELRDHFEPWHQAKMTASGSGGLVNGLGLGCIVAAMLDHLGHVDVVEKDERIAKTVGRWYEETYGPHHDPHR